MPRIVRRLFYLLWPLMLTTQSFTQTSVAYSLSWKHPNSHSFTIRAEVQVADGNAVDFRIPDWRPGRYMVQHFAKNIVTFRAIDGTGRTLPAKKIDKVTWRVKPHAAGRVIVEYTYYARQLDGGACYLDDSEAYFNPIACFVYIPGKEMLPVTLKIDKPDDWRIATAMPYDATGDLYSIDNYHDFADSPFLVSPSFRFYTFVYKGGRFELVFQGEADFDSARVVGDIRKIVAAQIDMMQDVPFERYLFMYHLLPYRFGHGVEHKNSTSIVIGPANFDDEGFYRRFLGVTSHEFFHAWNVERIRPEGIYLPDYSKPNYTTLLWVSEGMTSYYGGLTLVRAGLLEPKRYLESWARTVTSYRRDPGFRVTPVAEVSWDSWSKSFGAPPNTYYSFYTMGNMLGLALDLEIRHLTGNRKSLDDLFRYLNEKYAKKNRGLPEDGVLAAASEVSGHDFSDFFTRHVYGTQPIDWDRVLGYAGYKLEAKRDDKQPGVWPGIELRGDKKQTTIGNVLPESPAFQAGLDVGDILIAIDGRRAHAENFDLLLKKYAPGDTVRFTVIRREHLRTFDVVLAGARPDSLEIVDNPDASEQQLALRKSWLHLPEESENHYKGQ